MTRMIYYTASTLDGFLATEDHSLDWLLTRESGDGGPFDYEKFIAGIGAIAMGSSTYRWVLDHAGEDKWEYDLPCWVFTHRDDLPVARAGDDVGRKWRTMSSSPSAPRIPKDSQELRLRS